MMQNIEERKVCLYIFGSLNETAAKKEVVKKSQPQSFIKKIYIFYNFIVMDYHMMIIYVCIHNTLNIIKTTTSNSQTDERMNEQMKPCHIILNR